MKTIWGIFGASAPVKNPVIENVVHSIIEGGLVLDHVKITGNRENAEITGNLSIPSEAKSGLTIFVDQNEVIVLVKNNAGVTAKADFSVQAAGAPMIRGNLTQWLEKRLEAKPLDNPYDMQPMNELHL